MITLVPRLRSCEHLSHRVSHRSRPRPAEVGPPASAYARQIVRIFDSHSNVLYDPRVHEISIRDSYRSIPELMRVARGTYKRAADIELAAGGFEDLPTASGYLLAYLEDDEQSVPEKIEGLGIKRREFSQLIDALVLRGYITREFDEGTQEASLALTERGHAANAASFRGCNHVDAELERRLTETEIAGLRRGLAVLAEIKQSLRGPVLRRGLLRMDD